MTRLILKILNHKKEAGRTIRTCLSIASKCSLALKKCLRHDHFAPEESADAGAAAESAVLFLGLGFGILMSLRLWFR